MARTSILLTWYDTVRLTFLVTELILPVPEIDLRVHQEA